jgi:hypothetical protein
MDLPVDRQERRVALDAILTPFVDRAVAACAHARQASLRSDADNEKFAKAQMEGGYWLAPLKEAADYWAVEAARLQIVDRVRQARRGVAALERRGRHERVDRGREGARPIERRHSLQEARCRGAPSRKSDSCSRSSPRP